MGPPFRVSDYYGRHLLTEQQWILAEKLAEVSSKLLSGRAAPALTSTSYSDHD